MNTFQKLVKSQKAYYLLGNVANRGAYFLLLLSVGLVSRDETIADLGLFLLVSNSIAAVIGGPIASWLKYRLIDNDLVRSEFLVGLIGAFLLSLPFGCLFLVYSSYQGNNYSVIELVATIVFPGLLSLALICQSILTGSNKLQALGVLMFSTGLLILVVAILVGWRWTTNTSILLTLINGLQVIAAVGISIKVLDGNDNNVKVRDRPCRRRFLLNHAAYAAVGLPAFFVSQLIVVECAGKSALAPIVIATQFFALVSFVQYHQIQLLSKNIRKSLTQPRSLRRYLSSARRTIKRVNMFMGFCSAALVYGYSVIAPGISTYSPVTIFVLVLAVMYSADHWFFSEVCVASASVGKAALANALWALAFILLVWMLQILDVDSTLSYFAALGVSRVIAVVYLKGEFVRVQ